MTDTVMPAAWSTGRAPAGARSEAPKLEDLILASVLSIMVLLPVAEITFRQIGSPGSSASTTIVQHCTLVVSMLGAAIAARRD
ncbi:MAG: hypothetical protein ACXW2P_02280, partial [Thermoanaerobaculia bacterium]